MDSVKACNRIILNITDRDRSDMILYPLMIAVVLVSYIAIFVYYTISVFERYSGMPPWEHMFGVLALLLMGISLILAVFYLLMVRSANHSRREADLRKALIDYVEFFGSRKGADVSQHVKNLKGLDERYLRDERIGNPKRDILWVAAPGILGFMMMFIPQLEDHILLLISGCFLLSVIIALIVIPDVTTFGLKHDKRSLEFTSAFSNAVRPLNMKVVPMSKSVGYRNFGVFAILTLITLGAFSVVWTYMIFGDMNKHFHEQWKFEDHLFRMVRDTEIEYMRTRRPPEEELVSETIRIPEKDDDGYI
jgi:hypothetical protein